MEDPKKIQMGPVEQEIEQAVGQWRFWLFVTISLLLVAIFGLYLPIRFQYEEMISGHEAVYKEENAITSGIAIRMSTIPPVILTGSSTQFNFFVHTKPHDEPVLAGDLQYDHTKLMHVIGVRDDMNEYFHIHPNATTTPGVLITSHTFHSPGRYKIWSEIAEDDTNYVIGQPEIRVLGEGTASVKEISFEKSAHTGSYEVFLHDEEPIIAGESAEIALDVSDESGNEVPLEPFLGTEMHLTVIKDDLKQFIHAHPDESGDMHALAAPLFASGAHANGMESSDGPSSSLGVSSKSVRFHIMFPEAGLYKMFAQFRPAGIVMPEDEAMMVSFWVRVSESGPIRVSKLYLVLVSLGLIVIVSLAVKKILNVKK